MWVNCIYGGKGVGMINLLLFLIVGIFLAGQMVGRTPEYLGKKIGAREMKLAMIALLVHPIMILAQPACLPRRLGHRRRRAIPARTAFREIVYQFSSASANNGSAFDGLGVTYGFNNNPSPLRPQAVPGTSAAALVIIFSRYLPIIAPIAMAARSGPRSDSVRAGNVARRHLYLRLSAVRHDRDRRRAAVPAGGRARADGRASRADPVRRLSELRPPPAQRRTDTVPDIEPECLTPSAKSSVEVAHDALMQAIDTDAAMSPVRPGASPGAVRQTSVRAGDRSEARFKQAFVMLRPDIQWENPVMFVVEVGAVLTLLFVIQAALGQSSSQVPITYFIALDVWLFLTVLFANFATALAEARGKAQAESLRRTRRETPAYRLRGRQSIEEVLFDRPQARRSGRRDGGPDNSRRRRDHRRNRLGRRIGDHRRVGAGDSRGRRRPLRRDRRHQGALGPHRGADHRGARASRSSTG